MQQLDDPLVSLARYGAFATTPSGSNYYDRYAWQELHPTDSVKRLIEQKYARKLDRKGYHLVVPTRAGLEEAARRYSRETSENDKKLAIFGVHDWGLYGNTDGEPLAGLFLTQASGAKLLTGIAAALAAKPRSPSNLILAIGGFPPDALTNGLPSRSLHGAPNYTLIPLPAKLDPLTNVLHEYEFTIDLRPRHGTAVIFLTTGVSTRLLGPLTLQALTTAITSTSEKLTQQAKELEIDDALAEYPDLIDLEVML